ncbi:hypothetical protein [Asticcacaulis benevestitus]|nr:hypothetical protein [Asticcacaulis benevestitus]
MLKAFLVALGLLVIAPAVQAADCNYDQALLLSLDYKAFDQNMQGGWRPLAANKGCEPVAADLIRDFRAAHAELSANDRWILNWHEGQMRASFGDYGNAIPLLAADNPDPSTRDYGAATVAFLKHDKPALLAARTKLAAEPKPDGWDAAAADFKTKYGVTITWPSNLDVVDGLINCFDKPYAEAYDSTCRTKPAS